MPFDIDTGHSGYRAGLTSQMTDDHWSSRNAIFPLSHGVRGLCRGGFFSLSVGACWWVHIHCAAFSREHVPTVSRSSGGTLSSPSPSGPGTVHRNLMKRKARIRLRKLEKGSFKSGRTARTTGMGQWRHSGALRLSIISTYEGREHYVVLRWTASRIRMNSIRGKSN